MALKTPPIGQLRNIGHFENDEYRAPYTAGYVDGYTNVVTSVYCKIVQTNTKKVNEFGQVEVHSEWVMWCRFQSALAAALNDGTRFVQDGRRFDIIGSSLIDERRFYYRFVLTLSK
jgi:head-tail adaptor